MRQLTVLVRPRFYHELKQIAFPPSCQSFFISSNGFWWNCSSFRKWILNLGQYFPLPPNIFQKNFNNREPPTPFKSGSMPSRGDCSKFDPNNFIHAIAPYYDQQSTAVIVVKTIQSLGWNFPLPYVCDGISFFVTVQIDRVITCDVRNIDVNTPTKERMMFLYLHSYKDAWKVSSQEQLKRIDCVVCRLLWKIPLSWKQTTCESNLTSLKCNCLWVAYC